MVKRISILIISTALLVIGYYSFDKLNYWERSIRIFIFKNSEQAFGRRMGRGFPGFEGRGEFRSMDRSERLQRRDVPDSIRARFEGLEQNRDLRGRNMPDNIRPSFESRGRSQGYRGRVLPDSLRQQLRNSASRQAEGRPSDGRMGNRSGRGRDGYSRGRRININTVVWYLPVFAAFATITIYIDRLILFIRKRKKNLRVT